MTELEKMVYAAAVVEGFNSRHARGVHHSPFHEGGDIGKWEEWCMDCAIEDAEGMLDIYQRGVGRRAKARDRARRAK